MIVPEYERQKQEADDLWFDTFGRHLVGHTLRKRIAADVALHGRPKPKSECELIRTSDAPGMTPDYVEHLRRGGDNDVDDLGEIYAAKENSYSAVLENQTGRIIPDDAVEKLRARRDEMDARTIRLAQALECRGERFYYGPNHPGRCTVIGLLSGTELPLPAVRRTVVLPSVAAQARSKMLKDIEYFIARDPMRARMYTITNGPRVGIVKGKLRENIQAFHRRLSKLAKKLRDRFGLVIQWRATEFGSPQWDPETGQMTLHLHAHLLVTEPPSMHPKRRGKIRRKLWSLFGTHWDDAGRIENVREFVKYPVKPSDLETIKREAGPGVLCDFYEEVKGLHIVQPMGELKAERSRRRKATLPRRIVALTGPDGRYLSEEADWNAGKRPLAKPKKHRKELKKSAAVIAAQMETAQLAQMAAGGFDETPGEETADDNSLGGADDDGPAAPRISNRIIARLAPAPYGGAILEPAVVVWGYDGDLAAVLSQPLAARAIAQAAPAYTRARALARARARTAEQSSQRSDNCPRPPGRPWPMADLLAMSDGQRALEFAEN